MLKRAKSGRSFVATKFPNTPKPWIFLIPVSIVRGFLGDEALKGWKNEWPTVIDRNAHCGLAVFARRTERDHEPTLIGTWLALGGDVMTLRQPPNEGCLVCPDIVSLEQNEKLSDPTPEGNLL